MRGVIARAVSAAAIMGAAFGPAPAWAAIGHPGVAVPQHAHVAARSGSAGSPRAPAPGGPPGGDPPTTVTFTVTTGTLTITVPSAADLGSATDGTNATGSLGVVTVSDDRGLLNTSWVATASSTAFTTGTGTPDETIPAANATYIPGTVTVTGTVTPVTHIITLSGAAQSVVDGNAARGDNDASWNPTISVSIPGVAIGGLYTGTITHSVS
jgi:hypothetical protein